MNTIDKLHRRRLKILADFLRTVPKKRFEMTSWCTVDFMSRTNEISHNECGTAACAAGWACTIPSFRRVGFKMIKEIGWNYNSSYPSFRGYRDYNACIEFFGINQDQCFFIFGAFNKNSPIAAANRIEAVLKESQP